MNDPQDSVIEPVESEPPESADSDLSDEALDRPGGGGHVVPTLGAVDRGLPAR